MTDEIKKNFSFDAGIFCNFPIPFEAEISAQVSERMSLLKSKIELVNNGYELGCKKINDQCNLVKEQIDKKVYLLIMDILDKRNIIFEDIEYYKNEALLDFRRKFDNTNFDKNKQILNEAYENILEESKELICQESNENKQIKKLFKEKIDILIAKLDECCIWTMPVPMVNLVFTKNETDIQIPFIGDITYDSIYRVDMFTKLSCLNNVIHQRTIKLDNLIDKCILNKFIGLISKNKALVLYEKVFGKVTSVFIKIIYFNGTVLYEREICNIGSLVNYCVHNRHILLEFLVGKNEHIIHLYDTKLKFIQEKCIDYNIESIIMNSDTLVICSKKQPFVNEYDYELNSLRSYGQKKNEKKSFFVKDQIFAITNQKLYLRYQNEVRILCRFNGEMLSRIMIDGLKTSQIYLDFNKEKFIIYNGANKLSYHNHKGEMIQSTILKTNKCFDEFQYSKSGHFGFIDTKKNIILII